MFAARGVPIMACMHVPTSIDSGGRYLCLMCSCNEPLDGWEALISGRMARCYNYGNNRLPDALDITPCCKRDVCLCVVRSNTALPMFMFNRWGEFDMFYCGCMGSI